jgi:molybdopterin/thiamine biosynthesis adenylyltransferase/nitroreductase
MSDPAFSFAAAFDRNIGWLTEWEQSALRGKRVAIAGMGGVGGFHLATLARLGIGAFSIADLDVFEVVNFNRQIGATMPAVGRPKVQVMAEMARNINPGVRIESFDRGIDETNMNAFLEGADLFIDGFDFFVLGIRRKVFARCRELGIPALTAAPVGMGTGLLAFLPGGMSFEEYFRFEGRSELGQYVNFLLGLVPSAMHRKYLVDPSRLDFGNHRAPSTVIGCQLAASAAASAAVKLLLGRPGVLPAPHHHHYDAYLGKTVTTRLRWGNNGPLQRMKSKAVERMFETMLKRAPGKPEPVYPRTPLEDILDVARWTPSGDNAQPWRFEQVDGDTVIVRLNDDSGSNVYEYRGGEPSVLAGGMLLESLRIAATTHGRAMTWRYLGREDHRYRIEVRFTPADIAADPLYASIPIRSVDRRPYKTRRLSAHEKQALEAALGDTLAIQWHETAGWKWRLARLSAKATDIRLRIPEAYAVHRRIIDWTRNLSPTGIPAKAIGLDPMTLRIMRWAMQKWSRINLLNRLTGTLAPIMQMDVLPGLSSAAYFSIRLKASTPKPASPEERIETLLRAGRSLQRFWLTATKLGLAMQPALAVIAFANYGADGTDFTTDTRQRRAAKKLAAAFERTLGAPRDTLFWGRIGQPQKPAGICRSTRLPFIDLMASGGRT